jgi:hypothetical protein
MALFRVKPTEADVAIADGIAGAHGPTNRKSCGSPDVGRRRKCALRTCYRLVVLRANPRRVGAPRKRSCTTDYDSRLHPPTRSRKCSTRSAGVLGHLQGIPLSGKRLDAFPSGHAVHIGALASAATGLPSAQRNAVWAVGAGLVMTRIVLLAHWTRTSSRPGRRSSGRTPAPVRDWIRTALSEIVRGTVKQDWMRQWQPSVDGRSSVSPAQRYIDSAFCPAATSGWTCHAGNARR